MLSINDHKCLDYAYSLDDPAKIAKRLDDSDYIRREIQNFDLLSYHLEQATSGPLEIWLCNLEMLEAKGQNGFKFLLAYWESGRNTELFIKKISALQPEWLQAWTHSNLLSGEI